MNIAIVGDSIGLQSAGSLVSAWRFATLLVKRGHKVTLITTGKEDKFEIKEGVRIFCFRSKKTPFLEGSWRCPIFIDRKKIRKILIDEKIELTHVIVPTPFCFHVMKVSKSENIPIVSHFHMQPENLLTVLKLKWEIFNKIFYRYLGWFYSQSEILICPTKFGEQKIKPYLKKVKTSVISNGIDLSKFKIKKTSKKINKKFNIPRDRKIILYVGRLWPEKNVKTLIDSMKYLDKDKFHLIIVGKKEKEYERLVRRRAGLLLEDNISFTGRLTDSELIEFYNLAHLFCLPSIVELEGMVVLEAMAHGKPILISNSKKSASRFFVKRNGLLFETYNSKDLAMKIKRILSNEKLAKKMGVNSIKEVKKYDINKSIDKLISVYSSLLPSFNSH